MSCGVCKTKLGNRQKNFCSRVCAGKTVGKISHTAWNKDKSSSEVTKAKISSSLKGRKSPWVAEANSKRIYSETTRAKRSEVMKNTWNSDGFRAKLIERMSGENSPVWKKDRTAYQEKCRLRGTQEWRAWRESVFKRDDFTCQECGEKGVYLEPHHIVPLREDMTKLFNLENGITLCRPCHQKTMWKESEFAEKYTALTNSKMVAY